MIAPSTTRKGTSTSQSKTAVRQVQTFLYLCIRWKEIAILETKAKAAAKHLKDKPANLTNSRWSMMMRRVRISLRKTTASLSSERGRNRGSKKRCLRLRVRSAAKVNRTLKSQKMLRHTEKVPSTRSLCHRSPVLVQTRITVKKTTQIWPPRTNLSSSFQLKYNLTRPKNWSAHHRWLSSKRCNRSKRGRHWATRTQRTS